MKIEMNERRTTMVPVVVLLTVVRTCSTVPGNFSSN